MKTNAALMSLSGLLLRLISIGFQGWLSRRIGAEGMGLLQLVLTVGLFAGTLGSSGIRVAVLQLAARKQGEGDPAGAVAVLRSGMLYGLAVSGTVGLGLILLSGPIAAKLLAEPATAPALRVLGTLLPLSVLCGVLSACYTALGRVREQVAAELLERVFSVGLTLLFLWMAEGSLPRILCAVVGGAYGSCVLTVALLWGGIRTRPFRGSQLRPLIRLCRPLALNDYLRSGLSSLEQFLIPYGLGRGDSRRHGLAAYGTISGMVFPVLYFPAAVLYALSDLLVPELARAKARGRKDRVRSLVRRCCRGTGLYAAAFFLLLWSFGGRLGALLYHSARAGAWIRMFSPMVLFLYLDAIVDGMQKGLGQQVWLVRYNSFTNLLDVILLYTLLPRFGIGGFVFTYAFTHLVNFFLSLRRLLLAVEEVPQNAKTGAA